MPTPEDPSQPPARIARRGPSSAAARDRNSLRAAFEESETLDVHISGGPPLVDEHDSKVYLRAYTFGVTDEAAGRYLAEPEGELGRGAIGRVFTADDLHLGRRVAIKELLDESNDSTSGGAPPLQTISRFLREARVTGALAHPNIVPVYELGRRADGTLYYTMRIVPGRTLAQAIGESKRLDQRLSLVNHFSGLCQAIAYAHSRGIVHRDIKPDNVMIGEFGETVVLDWGMAKLCASEWNAQGNPGRSQAPEPRPAHAHESFDLTLEGSLCGTPLYMSPEQASGRSSEVDYRSDVWALGAVLYTILCGRTPFSGKSLLEIVGLVRAGRYTPLRAHDPRIPAELAAIVEHALCLNPSERYASARELARDVQAYQAGMRVTAYEYSSLDLLKRFVARHRAAVTVSTLAVVVLLLAGIAAYRRVVAARDRALVAEQRALEDELSARHSAEHARHSLGEVLLERALQALQEGDSVDAELLAARALGQEERADARGVVIAAQSTLRLVLGSTLSAATGCTRTAFSFPAGVFGCTAGRVLKLWNVPQRRLVESLPLEAEANALAFGSDASVLAVGLTDGTVRVRSLSSASDGWRTENCGAKPSAVAVTGGGRFLACASGRGQIAVWQAGSVTRWELGQAASALAFSENGAALAVGGELGALVVYRTSDHTQRRLEGHSGTVLALALAEQGRYLASGGADRTVRLWDTSNGNPLQAPITHSDAVSSVSWSDDRRFIALGGKDKTFRVVDLRSGRGALARQHDEAVELAVVSADGTELVSYSQDVGLRSWTLPDARHPSELNERGNVLALGLGANPEQLLSAGLGKNGVCVWDLSNGSCRSRLPVRLDRVRALAVSSDRTRLAVAGSGSQIFIWDLAQKIPTQVIDGLRGETRALAFSLDGRTLAAAGLERKLRLFDVANAALIAERETNAPVQTISVAPGSGALFTGDQAGVITVWDSKLNAVEASWQGHADWVVGSAISPDGSLFASAGADRSIKIWNAQSRKHLLTLTGHDGKVLSVDFSANSALLASASEDKTVRLWDARSGKPLATLTGHAGAVRSVRFTGQPTLLASGSDDGAIRLWHLEDLARPGIDLEAAITRKFALEPAR